MPAVDVPQVEQPAEQRRAELMERALKESVPLAALDPMCNWTSTKDQAAVDALNSIPVTSKEMAGALFKNEAGEWCYSVAVPGTRGDFRYRVDPQQGLVFDGIYHTHTGKNEGGAPVDMFSPQDIDMAKRLNKDSYIKVMRDGAIKKFQPGVTPVEPYRQPGKRRGQGGLVMSRGVRVDQASEQQRRLAETIATQAGMPLPPVTPEARRLSDTITRLHSSRE